MGLTFLSFWFLSRGRCNGVFQRPFCMLGDVLDVAIKKTKLLFALLLSAGRSVLIRAFYDTAGFPFAQGAGSGS